MSPSALMSWKFRDHRCLFSPSKQPLPYPMTSSPCCTAISALSGVARDPLTYYMAPTGGGVWKTVLLYSKVLPCACRACSEAQKITKSRQAMGLKEAILQEVREQGIEQKTRIVVICAYEKGFSPGDIAEIAALTVEEVEKIIEDYKAEKQSP